MRYLPIAFILSLCTVTVPAEAQTSAASSISLNGAANYPDGPAVLPQLAQLRQMIDRGHAAEALKELDSLAMQRPTPPGVDRLRGAALYSQNRFAEADIAFASALKQDAHDQE